MKIHYRGPFGQHTGYAQAGHDYLLALHRAGHELDIEPLFEWDHLDPRYHELTPMVERCELPGWADVLICHAPPFGCARLADEELAPPAGVHRVAWTTWETSQLPGAIGLDLSKHFDQIMVPCAQNQQAFVFGSTGVTRRCSILPHCFDPAFWPMKQASAAGPYTFYYIGAWNYRKNPRGVVLSYLSVFDKSDDVLLVLKVGGAQNVQAEIEAIKRSLNRPSYPAIELITGHLDDVSLRDVHLNADCFVSAHRGEGWGLGIFEAALVGNRFMATGFGGPTDYADSGWDYLVPYQRTPAMVPEELVPTHVPGVSAVRRVDPTGICGEQWWAEPDLWQLRRQMMSFATLGKDVRDDRVRFEAYSYANIAELFWELVG